MWKNNGRAGQNTHDSIMARMRFECRITKATDTHSECVKLISFPRQQWSRERASMLHYTCIVCLAASYNLGVVFTARYELVLQL